MTASAVPENAATTLRLIRSGLHLESSPEVASALGHLGTQVVRPVQEGHPQFGVDWRREPLPLWGDGTRRPDLGLRWLLEERARRQGRVVQVAREGVPFCDLELPADYVGGCAELMSWIAVHEIGLIQYASHVGLAILLRDIIRTGWPRMLSDWPRVIAAKWIRSIAIHKVVSLSLERVELVPIQATTVIGTPCPVVIVPIATGLLLLARRPLLRYYRPLVYIQGKPGLLLLARRPLLLLCLLRTLLRCPLLLLLTHLFCRQLLLARLLSSNFLLESLAVLALRAIQ